MVKRAEWESVCATRWSSGVEEERSDQEDEEEARQSLRLRIDLVEELGDDPEASAGSPHAEVEVVLPPVLDDDGLVVAVPAPGTQDKLS